MTTKQLLVPRVIVTNYYPNCPFEVGDVLTLKHVGNYKGKEQYYYCSSDYSQSDSEKWDKAVSQEHVERSTANFRVLQWWEKRDINDMPGYVALPWGNTFAYVHKVEKWEGANYKGELLYDYFNNKNALITASVSSKIPATEADYENYLNK